ncbi:MAG: hypothetical protein RLZZ450_981 [Pseudomonadota bacterium]|jgi:fatty-acyl-CoA synthase
MASPVDNVALHARLAPERLAAVDLASDLRWSYAALDRDVARCVTVLSLRGCKPGDRVVAIAKNHVLQLILHLACARLGAVYTPLNVRLSGHELSVLVERARPRITIGDERLERRVHEDLVLTELLAALPHAAPARPEPIDPDRPSLMLFTSGTTGRPKGVLLSERNISETALNFTQLARVDRHSRFLGDAPMFHTIGLLSNTRPALHAGGACLLSESFDPAVTLARLADRELAVSHYFCVPQMAAALRAQPHYEPGKLSGLTALFTGGATHAAEAIRTFVREGIAVADGYGMSELGCVLGMPLELSVIDHKAGSVGLSTARVQTRVVDDAGQPCAVGTPGELWVRGETVFAGYYESPEDTRAAFVDGWFRTGDLVKVDDDGFHYVLDRKKDMFISGGENVYPAEIESCLLGLFDLAEAAVVGVPDERWGEVGHLVIVPVHGKTLEPARILAFLNERLARYKVPRFVTELTALPRTGTGKVQKHAIRSLLVSNEAR